MGDRRWQFWIDRGGTFTDLVGRSPDGRLVVRKVLSEPPRHRDGHSAIDPAIGALRQVLGLAAEAPLPDGLVEEVRLGTTVATNSLLERQMAPVLLLVNRGFADLPVIGDQHRPDLFALQIRRPAPLSLRVIEIGGRLGVDGREREALRLDDDLKQALAQARADGYTHCAVALLHGARHPVHELAVGSFLKSCGFSTVVLSHQVSRQPRLVPRIDTTVLEAALEPVLTSYLNQVQGSLGSSARLRVMTSGGVLQSPGLVQAKDTILSGPAGGMVGAVEVARAAGFGTDPILGFDMGGTSTDVFHFDGSRGDDAWERSQETAISGLRLLASMLPIHTVAAGGGSVLHGEGGRLQVGPRSAGAHPGPACYRWGGPLTITDANLLLGRLPRASLPAVFGPTEDQPLDAQVVRERFAALALQLGAESPEALAQGALAIAIERMAQAIRCISTQRGHDLRRAVLIGFGSAAGQVVCSLATCLGMERVLLHPLAGVLSAYGIGLSRQSLLRDRTLRLPLTADLLASLAEGLDQLAAEAVTALRMAGDLGADQRPQRLARLELRYSGSDQGLDVVWPSVSPDGRLAQLRAAFEHRHRQRFGYVVEGEELVVERLQVEVSAPREEIDAGQGALVHGPGDAPILRQGPRSPSGLPPQQVPLAMPRDPTELDGVATAMEWRSVPLWSRENLQEGQALEGPALLVEPTGTVVLEPGWGARVLARGELLLERRPSQGKPQINDQHPTGPFLSRLPDHAHGQVHPLPSAQRVDPVQLELYNHRFSAIAEQMGMRLQQCSRSVNIRERLDFSCALFDGAGRLVANAPHIPVHLGSMGESVASLVAAVERGQLPPLEPGDAFAANDPFNGGTHLPDITVISPVFATPSSGSARAGGSPLFFVACRGHHADVGGITPGSMPPFSHHIEEEGLLLDNVPLLRHGRFNAAQWSALLAKGVYPVRNPDQMLADLQAQIAANQLGVEELDGMLHRHGFEEVVAYMAHVQANAAEAVRQVIDLLHDGSHAVELDGGAWIRVSVRVDRQARRVRIDFGGTSPQQPSNVNAPLAITKAAVLYVFRCLVGQPIPLNAGCFEPLELIVPCGSLLHPRPPAAVVAGNVETSQAVTNALFAALGVMGAAQGTMNNISFGDERLQYYETLCGGTGAGTTAAIRPNGGGFEGTSAIQSHMTNSRLTDPEILEDRFPVELKRFSIRRGTGGAGRWRGGDGAVRELEFLEPMTAAILSGSRRVAPFGLAGGEPGSIGHNWIIPAAGPRRCLEGCAQLMMEAGDRLVIETPGGGGYGQSVPQSGGEA